MTASVRKENPNTWKVKKNKKTLILYTTQHAIFGGKPFSQAAEHLTNRQTVTKWNVGHLSAWGSASGVFVFSVWKIFTRSSNLHKWRTWQWISHNGFEFGRIKNEPTHQPTHPPKNKHSSFTSANSQLWTALNTHTHASLYLSHSQGASSIKHTHTH